MLAGEKYMDPEEFNQFLRDQGFIVNVIKPDANCLFRAIAKEVLGDEDKYMELKEDLRHHVNVNQNWEPYLTYFTGKSYAAIQREIAEIGQEKVWGGQLALLAACQVCHHNIIVHVPFGPAFNYPENPTLDPTMHLSWHQQSQHYNHLEVPAGDSDDDSTSFDNDDSASRSKDKDSNDDTSNERSDQNSDEMDDSDDNLAENMDEEFPDSEDEIGEEDDQNQQPITDDAEDDFTKDFPSVDPNDYPTSDLTSLLNSYSFKFLANKFFDTSRNYLDVFILVPEEFCRDTLAESLTHLNNSEVYLLLDYCHGNIEKDLLSDGDVREMYVVFKKRINLPGEIAMHTRSVWLTDALIIPLLISALRYTWNNVRVETLCKTSTRALASHLLNYYWKEMRSKITRYVETIMTNPGALFCNSCADTCVWKHYSWHINLDGFQKQDFEEASMYGFWRRYNLFKNRLTPKAEVMQMLRTVFSSNGPLPLLLNLLDKNSDKYTDVMYSSYLVLVLDGQNMDKYKKLSVDELLKKTDVYKLLYAGCCLKEEFRASHFEKKSAIFDVLTKHSKMFFVRQKWYKSRDAARTDEAVIIELLKTVVNRHHRQGTFPGFFLLNNTSSPSFLFRLNPRYMDIMTRFCDSAIPVIKMDDENDELFQDGVFSGNYKVETAVTMKPGPYEAREFQDVAEIYEAIKSKR